MCGGPVMKLENNLGTDPVKSLVWRIAIPSMLAQFVGVLYSIVDRIYISNIPGRGCVRAGGDNDRRFCLPDWDRRRAADEYPNGGGEGR